MARLIMMQGEHIVLPNAVVHVCMSPQSELTGNGSDYPALFVCSTARHCCPVDVLQSLSPMALILSI
jgi:hypothetical protein